MDKEYFEKIGFDPDAAHAALYECECEGGVERQEELLYESFFFVNTVEGLEWWNEKANHRFARLEEMYNAYLKLEEEEVEVPDWQAWVDGLTAESLRCWSVSYHSGLMEEALQGCLPGLDGFHWESSPQGYTYWDARYSRKVPLSLDDIAFLTALKQKCDNLMEISVSEQPIEETTPEWQDWLDGLTLEEIEDRGGLFYEDVDTYIGDVCALQHTPQGIEYWEGKYDIMEHGVEDLDEEDQAFFKALKEKHAALVEDKGVSAGVGTATITFTYHPPRAEWKEGDLVKYAQDGMFTTKDSGVREEFPTGSVRDTREGKGRFDLISTSGLRRLAGLYERGATKYGDRNWEKGQPLGRYLDSAMRHLVCLMEGKKDEDHAAAVAWNAFGFMHTAERIKEGKLPANLDDIQWGAK